MDYSTTASGKPPLCIEIFIWNVNMRLFELFAHQAALERIRAYGAHLTSDLTTSPALPAAKSAKQNECAAHNS